MRRSYNGFTLVEIMVTIAILGILSSVLVVGVVQSGKKSRDIDRQSDLREMQSAVELYKQRYGRYPAACNGANTWSGQPGTAFACTSGTQYIVGLAPEFMPALPYDKKLNGSNSGYVFYTNAAGTAYKIVAHRTVEADSLTDTHPFRACDAVGAGVCNGTSNVLPWSGNTPPYCQNGDPQFEITYAVWGGFPPEPFTSINRREEQVESVVCRLP